MLSLTNLHRVLMEQLETLWVYPKLSIQVDILCEASLVRNRDEVGPMPARVTYYIKNNLLTILIYSEG